MSTNDQPRLHTFEVAGNQAVGEGVYALTLRAPELARALRPGQFFEIDVPGDARHIVRLPFSFASTDPEAGTILVIVRVVGEGSERLCAMGVGENSTVIGPCGNGWCLDGATGPALIVSGGVGSAPIVAAASELAGLGIAFDAVVGVQSASLLWGTSELEALGAGKVVVSTDDGSAGYAGYAPAAAEELMNEKDYKLVLTCGPTIMMAGVAKLAAERGIACKASLERMMTCGFGACGTCNVALVGGGYASCCTQGPVFDAQEVVW